MSKEYGEYDFVWLAAAYVAASVVEHGAMLAFTFAPAFEGGEKAAAFPYISLFMYLRGLACAAWLLKSAGWASPGASLGYHWLWAAFGLFADLMGVALFVLFNEARQPHRPKPSSPAFHPDCEK